MWWKQNKWKVLVPLLIVAALAVAFWYGGGAPGLQGWTVEKPSPAAPSPSAVTAPAPTPTPPPAPSPSEAPSLPPEDAKPSAAPSAEPSPEPSASPEPSLEAPASPSPTMATDPSTGKDQYQTDPVPEGKPAPVEPEDAAISDVAHTCTISIECATILDHLDWLDPEKEELVPGDGVILPETTVTFYEGESVFNVLQRTCKQNKIHMEFENTPIYNSAYIEGIHNLYEFDCGEQSGWMYSVNGWYPNYGCSRYALQDGDQIRWRYTCNYGEDVGGSFLGRDG